MIVVASSLNRIADPGDPAGERACDLQVLGRGQGAQRWSKGPVSFVMPVMAAMVDIERPIDSLSQSA